MVLPQTRARTTSCARFQSTSTEVKGSPSRRTSKYPFLRMTIQAEFALTATSPRGSNRSFVISILSHLKESVHCQVSGWSVQLGPRYKSIFISHKFLTFLFPQPLCRTF